MTNEIQILFIAIILTLIVWSMYLIHLYKKEQIKANILKEQLDIRRYIEKGNRADKVMWDYHNVTYLNNSYNIKVKNIEQKRRTLAGGKK